MGGLYPSCKTPSGRSVRETHTTKHKDVNTGMYERDQHTTKIGDIYVVRETLHKQTTEIHFNKRRRRHESSKTRNDDHVMFNVTNIYKYIEINLIT